MAPRGLRAASGGVPGTIAALLDQPGLRAVGAAAAADGRGLRIRARSVGTGKPRGTVSALAARVPAGAIAMLAAPDAARGRAAARGWAAPACSTPSAACSAARRSLDADRDLLGRLQGFTAWIATGAAAPVIGLAAHTDDPEGLREVLAPLQDPVARALAERPGRAAAPSTPRRSPAWTPSRCGVSDGFAAHLRDQRRHRRRAPPIRARSAPSSPAADARLTATPAFRSAIPSHPDRD